jgi:hypothetical protein
MVSVTITTRLIERTGGVDESTTILASGCWDIFG